MIHSISQPFRELMQILQLAFRDRIQILCTSLTVFVAAVTLLLVLPRTYAATVTLDIRTQSPIDRRSRSVLPWEKAALSDPVLSVLQTRLIEQPGVELQNIRKNLRASTPHHWSKLELQALGSDANTAIHIATQWAEVLQELSPQIASWRAQPATRPSVSHDSRFRIWRIGILAAACSASLMAVRSAVRHGRKGGGEQL